MRKLTVKTLVLILSSALPILTYAEAPAVTIQGMGGTYASGWIDGLVPLYRNDNSLIFSDIQLQGANTNAGMLSAGGGYRQQINENGILGAYLFYDRERSANENYYNVISPGVEYMTPSWHYRLNYYASFGTKTYATSSGWADTLGDDQYLEWSGHDGIDRWETQYEALSYGADFNIGYRFQSDKRWEVEATPYAFNQTDANTLMGANAQLNFYSNNETKIFLGDGYDNVNHNRIFIGIALTFGGHNNDDTVSNLMMSPIYRNQDVNTTANSLPVNEYKTFGPSATEYTNVYFINNSDHGVEEGYGTPYEGDGTYENPYQDIYAVSYIENPNADIRVASTGKAYDLPPGDGYGSPATIELKEDQSMAGYTNDYKTLAAGNDRPIIYAPSGIVLNGDNTLTGLQIRGYNLDGSVGITINGTALLDDILVGTTEYAYTTGVSVANNASATITDSVINASYDSNSSGNIYGVKTGSDSALVINNSTINATATGNNSSDNNSAYGLYVGSGSTSNVSNSIINSTVMQNTQAWGVFLDQSGDATFSHDIINAQGTGSGGSGYGLVLNQYTQAFTIDNSTINVNAHFQSFGIELNTLAGGSAIISNSDITAKDGASAAAIGVYLPFAEGNTTINNSTITVNAEGSQSEGIYNAFSTGDLAISSSTISASSSADNASVYGIDNAGVLGSVTLDSSTINAANQNQTSTSTIGIYSVNSGDMTINNSTINVNSSWSGDPNDNPSAVAVQLANNQGVVSIANSTLNVTETGTNSTAAGIWDNTSSGGSLSTSNVTFDINADTADDVWGVV